jgi:hypothetical protein
MAQVSANVRVYDAKANWANTLRNTVIDVKEDESVGDLQYQGRHWRFSHRTTIPVKGKHEEWFVFVPAE